MSFPWQCYLRGAAPNLVSLVSILSTLSPGKVPGETRGQTGLPENFRQKAPEIHGSLVSPRAGHLRFGGLAGVLEQEVQRLVGLDVAGDAAQRAKIGRAHG